METREPEQMSSDSSEEGTGPEEGTGATPPEGLDSDQATAADSAMPTLPPRVEPSPTPYLDRTPQVEERLVSLDLVDEDDAFQLRPAGDVGRLAMDLARLGQAFPVEVRLRDGSDRFQLVSGARLGQEGRLSAAARDMLERARATDDDLAPESVESDEEEIDADELAAELTARIGELNQDLALLAPVFDALEPGQRAELLQQLRYAAELVAYFDEEES